MSHLTRVEQIEAELLAALEDYNRMYPDVPIRHLGDTPDRIVYLLGWTLWRDGQMPLDPDTIAAIERRAEDIEGFSQPSNAVHQLIKRSQVGGRFGG